MFALLFTSALLYGQKVYEVKYESQADFKIYFVENESQADLKVFYVEYESQAGWKNEDKKHLLCGLPVS